MALGLHRGDGRDLCRADNTGEPFRPKIEGGDTLAPIIVLTVDRERNARSGHAAMIDNMPKHDRSDAKRGHLSNGRAWKVAMRRPWRGFRTRQKVLVPSGEDSILISLASGVGGNSGDWAIDVGHRISVSSLDWDRIVDMTVRRGLVPTALSGLTYLRSLGVTVPERAISSPLGPGCSHGGVAEILVQRSRARPQAGARQEGGERHCRSRPSKAKL